LARNECHCTPPRQALSGFRSSKTLHGSSNGCGARSNDLHGREMSCAQFMRPVLSSLLTTARRTWVLRFQRPSSRYSTSMTAIARRTRPGPSSYRSRVGLHEAGSSFVSVVDTGCARSGPGPRSVGRRCPASGSSQNDDVSGGGPSPLQVLSSSAELLVASFLFWVPLSLVAIFLWTPSAAAQPEQTSAFPDRVVQTGPHASSAPDATAPQDLGLPSWAAPNSSAPGPESSWSTSGTTGEVPTPQTSSGPGFPEPPQEVPISGTGLAVLAAAGALYAVRNLKTDGEAENDPA
jgi:hypothetical protein